jgi:hypothetical protein
LNVKKTVEEGLKECEPRAIEAFLRDMSGRFRRYVPNPINGLLAAQLTGLNWRKIYRVVGGGQDFAKVSDGLKALELLERVVALKAAVRGEVVAWTMTKNPDLRAFVWDRHLLPVVEDDGLSIDEKVEKLVVRVFRDIAEQESKEQEGDDEAGGDA